MIRARPNSYYVDQNIPTHYGLISSQALQRDDLFKITPIVFSRRIEWIVTF